MHLYPKQNHSKRMQNHEKIVILYIIKKIKSLPYVSTKSQFEIDFQDADGAKYILIKLPLKQWTPSMATGNNVGHDIVDSSNRGVSSHSIYRSLSNLLKKIKTFEIIINNIYNRRLCCHIAECPKY